MEVFFVLTIVCLAVITVGYFIHKYLRLPWMFTVVILGMTFTALGWFTDVMQSANFQFLSRLGMLFFLFSIGLDLEIDQIKKLGKHIVIGNIALTLTEGFVLALFFFFVYPEFVSHSFGIALLAGIAFGTVGEVILLALLKEFGLEKTKFGQLALGIGVFDDIFEILSLALIISLPALRQGNSQGGTLSLLLTFFGLLLATLFSIFIGKFSRKHLSKIPMDSFVIPFGIFLFMYAFIYLGSQGDGNLSVIAAIFSGISVKQFLPEQFINRFKKPIFFVANIFLGPFFFLSLGGKMSINAIASFPLLILAIIMISITIRMLISYLLFHKILGQRQSLILGIGLTAKFSTSVVSENLLFSSGLIALPLYSAIMAAFIILKPIIVAVFSSSLAASRHLILQNLESVPVEVEVEI